jgi:SAM-dependent methyltransferase
VQGNGLVTYPVREAASVPAEHRAATYLETMMTWKTLTRLAMNRVTLSRALGESVLTHLRDSVMREHRISLACVAGGGKTSPGSESVLIDALESSARCLVVNLRHAWCPDVIADLVVGWPFKEAVFDLIVSTWVIEHVSHPEPFFREAFRLLKPGGAIVYAVPFLYHKHGSPDDYWRLTDTALLSLARAASFQHVVTYKVGGTPFIACLSLLWPWLRLPGLGLLMLSLALMLDGLLMGVRRVTGKGHALIDAYPLNYIIYAKK